MSAHSVASPVAWDSSRPLAILSALAQEQAGLVEQLQEPCHLHHAGRDFWSGRLAGLPVVLALSRVGKVAAAATTAALIERFGVGGVVFTGVAGGVGAGVQVGDIVIGSAYLQHDMDASPLFPRYQIPLTGQTVLSSDTRLQHAMHQACVRGLEGFQFQGLTPTIHVGLIASGDQFISTRQAAQTLRATLQDHGHAVLAVEMEGAAVAQVCADYQRPFVAVRAISDRADEEAHVDFPRFVEQVASVYAQRIVQSLVRGIAP